MGLFVGYSQKRRTVRIVDFGRPRVIICPDGDILLTAVLTDETNLRNHTIYWEQIEGTDVILSSNNELQVAYSFVENSNKTFRFYLDYGTNKEQYKDIEIFHTPTSFQYAGISEGGDNYIHPTIPDYTLTPDFIVPLDDYSYAPVSLTPVMRIDYSALSLGLQGQLVSSEILTSTDYTHNPQDVLKTYTPGNDPRSHLLARGVYKFVTYSTRDDDIIRYSSPLIVSNPPHQTDKGDPYVNEVLKAGISSGNLNNISRTVYIIKSVLGTIQPSSRSFGYFDSIVRRTYTTKNVLEVDQYASRSFGYFDSIIRFDNSGVGN